MATKQIAIGTVTISFGFALILAIFGVFASSTPKMSSPEFSTCIFLGVIAIVWLVLSSIILNKGLQHVKAEEDKKREKDEAIIKRLGNIPSRQDYEETLKIAFREILKEVKEKE